MTTPEVLRGKAPEELMVVSSQLGVGENDLKEGVCI